VSPTTAAGGTFHVDLEVEITILSEENGETWRRSGPRFLCTSQHEEITPFGADLLSPAEESFLTKPASFCGPHGCPLGWLDE